MTATLETLLSRLPAWQQALAEDAEAQRADRDSHVAALKKIEQHELAERPRLLKLRDEAQRKLQRARETLRDAEAACNAASRDCWNLSARTDQQRQQHHVALEASASPLIDQFLERLQAERARVRREPTDAIEGRSENPRTYGERIIVRTNRDKIVARLAVVSEAIEATRRLKYTVATDAELQQRFDEIWHALPDTQL